MKDTIMHQVARPAGWIVLALLVGVGVIAACSPDTPATPSQTIDVASTTVALSSVPINSPVPEISEELTPTPSSSEPSLSPVLGVFEGITPCSNVSRPMPQISETAECEMMIWHITFQQDPATGASTTYKLTSSYGMPQPNTLGIAGGGTKIELAGKWSIVRGAQTDPEAIVYQLNPDAPETSVSFLKVSDNLLHVLSADGSLMVGNGGWSYTLNRTDNGSSAPVAKIPNSLGVDAPTPFPLPTPAESSVFGVFEGRTLCHELALSFTEISLDYGCNKLKWQLTLYQDPTTLTPTTFIFRGTRSTRSGAWVIIQGTPHDPDAVIYQLTPEDSQQPLSFLQVDPNSIYMLDTDLNLLVGDALWNYTLSRVEQDDQ